jgi:hypothetical protein
MRGGLPRRISKRLQQKVYNTAPLPQASFAAYGTTRIARAVIAKVTGYRWHIPC